MISADRKRQQLLCRNPLQRQPDRLKQYPKPQYPVRRPGRCDLLDEPVRLLRPADQGRHQLEDLYRAGFRGIVCI